MLPRLKFKRDTSRARHYAVNYGSIDQSDIFFFLMISSLFFIASSLLSLPAASRADRSQSVVPRGAGGCWSGGNELRDARAAAQNEQMRLTAQKGPPKWGWQCASSADTPDGSGAQRHSPGVVHLSQLRASVLA